MPYGSTLPWRRLVASTTLCALLVATVGCTTTKHVRFTATAPPAPESEVLIVGAKTNAGEEIRFSEPATIELLDTGDPRLTGWAMTTYQGNPADQRLSLRLNEVAEYELATEERKPDMIKNVTILLVLGAIVYGLSQYRMDLSGMNLLGGGCCG